MSMDITPPIQAGRKLIEGYGGGGFRIAGDRLSGSVLVFPERTAAWAVERFAELTLESLAEVTAETPAIEVLLIGCGERPAQPPLPLLRGLADAGVAAEFMDTGAACRTFNVLLAEDRRVAAALIAVA
jgi:uncharacterized protein